MIDGEISWLPDKVLLSDYHGDWGAFIKAAYAFFAADFITSTPSLNGRLVKSKRHVAYEGMDHSFWHCIEEQVHGEAVSEGNRIPKIALCERIRWPRPIIERAVSSPDILAWTEIRRGHGASKRVHLLLKKERYVVVLDPRGKDAEGLPNYYYLWTTFVCEGDRRYNQIIRRYENGEKMN